MPSPLQDEDLYPSVPNTYAWTQTEDQLTISFLVPDNFKAEDASVLIEANYVKAGIKDRVPIIKGCLYSTIRHHDSLWQIDKSYNHSGFSSPASSASSFSFVTPPASPLSSLILPSAASSEYGIDSTGSLSPSLLVPSLKSQSQSSSINSLSAHSSIHSIPTPPIQRRYRLLTLHLEKAEYLTWPVLIIQGEGDKYDMDATSLFHWAEVSVDQKEAENAFQYYIHAAELGHPKAMVKVAAMYEIGSEGATNTPIFPSRSPRKAFEWSKRAADLTPDADGTGSHPDPEACLIVGLTYFNGQTSPEADSDPAFIVEKDYTLALQYLQKTMMLTAPFLDFSRLSPTPPTTPMQRYFCSAAFQAGLIHMQGGYGLDDEPNERMAVEYWRQSSWCGHAESAFNIGILCQNGLSTPTLAEPEHEVDQLEAGRWFVRAKKLDISNSIIIPEGINLAEWDTAMDDPLSASSMMASSNKKKRKKRRKSAKTKANSSGVEDDAILWALGATVAAGALVGGWYLWKRGRQD